MDRPRIIVLMTALLPTVGHKALIEFACQYAAHKKGYVHVIVSSRSKEPIKGSTRIDAINREFSRYNDAYMFYATLHDDDNAPQNPNPELEWDSEFWDYWVKTIETQAETPIKPIDVVIASEPYGMQLAKALNCQFIPYDIDRSVINVKGTTVRQGYMYAFEDIMPSFRKELIKTVTIFGADSCGKTTTAKKLAKHFYGHFIPEWARPYLETVGKELTPEKMQNIIDGQLALQKTANTLIDKPFIFQDTDLFSTLGYYRILGWEVPKNLIISAKYNASDHYIVMSSDIPFVPDQLRYGGDKRESNDQFWIDILNEFEIPYSYVDDKNFKDRFEHAKDIVSDKLVNWELMTFKRD